MSTILSWHKRGQKVACIKVGAWHTVSQGWRNLFRAGQAGPKLDEVVTIAEVVEQPDGVWFRLVECPGGTLYIALAFRPVYPQRIEELRNLDVPLPEHEMEGRVTARPLAPAEAEGAAHRRLAEVSLERTDAGGSEFEVLNKPDRLIELIRRVRRVLDGATGVE